MKPFMHYHGHLVAMHYHGHITAMYHHGPPGAALLVHLASAQPLAALGAVLAATAGGVAVPRLRRAFHRS